MGHINLQQKLEIDAKIMKMFTRNKNLLMTKENTKTDKKDDSNANVNSEKVVYSMSECTDTDASQVC